MCTRPLVIRIETAIPTPSRSVFVEICGKVASSRVFVCRSVKRSRDTISDLNGTQITKPSVSDQGPGGRIV